MIAARLGKARRDKDGLGKARLDLARLGTARQREAWWGPTGLGDGVAGQGKDHLTK